MAVCNQYQNSELSPANCLLVGGFCDSLELEDLTLHAFRIESSLLVLNEVAHCYFIRLLLCII